MIIRSRAPLRISFAGGGTDISPYAEQHGGCVLNATIDKYAYGTLKLRDDNTVNVHSLDYDIIDHFVVGQESHYTGQLDLVKATIKAMNIKQGMDVFMHSDAPPGSGLGSSSAMTVVLVGLFKYLGRLSLTDYEIAELAYTIERKEVGILGGRQDQYAASFGGFNFLEFSKNETVVNPLRIKRDTLNELQYRLMMCYTGKRRSSAGIIAEQVNGFQHNKESVVRAMDETKALAVAIKNALLVGKINEFGYLLHQGWLAKKNFSEKMTDSNIDEIYDEARKNGALGGKLLGAGGGGYFLFLCQFDKRHNVAEKIERCGAKVTNFAWDLRGLETWSVNS